jgi:hypothetical protein
MCDQLRGPCYCKANPLRLAQLEIDETRSNLQTSRGGRGTSFKRLLINGPIKEDSLPSVSELCTSTPAIVISIISHTHAAPSLLGFSLCLDYFPQIPAEAFLLSLLVHPSQSFPNVEMETLACR